MERVHHLIQKATFLNFMIMQIIKPESEGTLFREYWKERSRKMTEQDWTKIYWNEVENE